MANFTELYCDAASGNNMNGGSDAGSASYTPTNGGWNSGTGIFTPTSGNPSLSVTVGQMASVFTDGTTTPAFVGRVTARDTTTVTISVTAKIGTVPTTAGSGISIRVGGAWAGPVGSVLWPMVGMDGTLKNSSGDYPRVNYKSGTSYLPTSSITMSACSDGNVRHEGYTTSVGDGGRATLDFGSTSGLGLTQANFTGLAYFIVTASASAGAGVGITGATSYCVGCVATGFRASGFSGVPDCRECEAYGNNTANSSNLAGFISCTSCIRCISHDNTGSNAHGFYSCNYLSECIADTNGGYGAKTNLANGAVHEVVDCDFYNNTAGGIDLNCGGSRSCFVFIESSNFIKNGTYGINNESGVNPVGSVKNCGFGMGTQANSSGTTNNLKGIVESGSINYGTGLTPWVDPANGDFRINLAAAKNAGVGTFTQTAASYSGTIGYPDIGAAQHLDSGGGGGSCVIGSGVIKPGHLLSA